MSVPLQSYYLIFTLFSLSFFFSLLNNLPETEKQKLAKYRWKYHITLKSKVSVFLAIRVVGNAAILGQPDRFWKKIFWISVLGDAIGNVIYYYFFPIFKIFKVFFEWIRLAATTKGNIEELLYEGMAIQRRLKSDKEGMTVAKISLTLRSQSTLNKWKL